MGTPCATSLPRGWGFAPSTICGPSAGGVSSRGRSTPVRHPRRSRLRRDNPPGAALLGPRRRRGLHGRVRHGGVQPLRTSGGLGSHRLLADGLPLNMQIAGRRFDEGAPSARGDADGATALASKERGREIAARSTDARRAWTEEPAACRARRTESHSPRSRSAMRLACRAPPSQGILSRLGPIVDKGR